MAQPFAQPCDDGVIRAEPCPRAAGREVAPTRKRWVLAACVLASSMAFIDGSALTVALPALRADFSASLQDVQWVLNAYVLALAALTLLGGAIADRYGRARTLLWGCAVFALASIACALAPSLETLIFARLMQGVGAAIMTPASLALIGEVYPEDERGKAIGTWAAASALTTAGGPLLGGWLTVTFGWEAVFWINPPIAVVAVAILLRTAPTPHQQDRALDWTGGLILSLALAALAYWLSGLSLGEGAVHVSTASESGPSMDGTAALVAGVILLAALAWQQRRFAHPMLSPELFASAQFVWLNLATLFLYGGLSIMFFLLPFHLIEARGLTATQAGLCLLPFTLLVGVLSRFAGGLSDTLGARPVLAIGAALAAAGHFALSVLSEADLLVGILLPLTIIGLGFAALVAPLTSSVMGAVAEEDTGKASGINNTASRIAQLLGVAGAAALAPLAAGYSLGMACAAGLCGLGGAAFLMVPKD
ncbi:MAG: MFS transporter [Pseudomonadota bacterium]